MNANREACASTNQPNGSRAAYVTAVVVAVAVLVAVLPANGRPASATDGIPQIAVSFKATDYRYQIVTHGAVPGFEAVGFDASDWSVGAAPFGTTAGPCPFNIPAEVATIWPVNTDLLVRRTFTLPTGAHNLRAVGTIDNNATVYINGAEIGFVSSGFCNTGAINMTAPDSLLQAGTNLLAIRGHDFGVASYLDVQITYNAPLYSICALYDQTKASRSGSVVPVRFQLCDASGVNVSDAGVVVHVTGLHRVDSAASAEVEDAGNANPDDDFRYDASLGGGGGYIFNKSTKGLTTGTWKLTFSVDGIEHENYQLLFGVR